MCWGAIKNSRISKVVFAAKDTRNLVAASYDCLVENGLLENESVEILQKFFRNVRRIKGDSGTKLLPCAT
jgi:tRNA(adenine34) deaminase